MCRLKPYTDPAARPIRQPPEGVDDPYLTETDLPPDSFEAPEIIPTVDDTDTQDTPPVPDPSTTVPPLFPAPDVYQAVKLLRQRLYKGQPQYEVQWKDSWETTWEPVENILDKRLITKYYEDHPRARNLLTATQHRQYQIAQIRLPLRSLHFL